eukprot:scaffold23809_cov74-Phaeocystis_antarctica.AAC.4
MAWPCRVASPRSRLASAKPCGPPTPRECRMPSSACAPAWPCRAASPYNRLASDASAKSCGPPSPLNEPKQPPRLGIVLRPAIADPVHGAEIGPCHGVALRCSEPKQPPRLGKVSRSASAAERAHTAASPRHSLAARLRLSSADHRDWLAPGRRLALQRAHTAAFPRLTLYHRPVAAQEAVAGRKGNRVLHAKYTKHEGAKCIILSKRSRRPGSRRHGSASHQHGASLSPGHRPLSREHQRAHLGAPQLAQPPLGAVEPPGG